MADASTLVDSKDQDNKNNRTGKILGITGGVIVGVSCLCISCVIIITLIIFLIRKIWPENKGMVNF